MEISVRKFDLLSELLLLQGAIERKTTMPILANIMAEAMPDGRLQLAATDLDLGLTTSCAAGVKKSGGCALPARKLLDYIKLLPDAELSMKRLENHWVQIRCGRSNTRLVGMSRENFPEMPEFPDTGVVKIPAAALKGMIVKTIFAISAEESRYTLSGALMVMKPHSLAMVSTDGHRLAHIVDESIVLEGVTAESKALVPRKAMAQLQMLLETCADEVAVEFAQSATHLFFRLPHDSSGFMRSLSVRKLTGQFPNYEAVLPSAKMQSVRLHREEFLASIERVSQFADVRTRAVRVKMEPGKMNIASSGNEGETDEEIDIDYTAEPVAIGYNAKYLSAFLEVVASDEVLLEFKDDSSAGQLRPLTTDGPQYRYVVMPMRI
jgi:DNA polymerase-3 subunit beta